MGGAYNNSGLKEHILNNEFNIPLPKPLPGIDENDVL